MKGERDEQHCYVIVVEHLANSITGGGAADRAHD